MIEGACTPSDLNISNIYLEFVKSIINFMQLHCIARINNVNYRYDCKATLTIRLLSGLACPQSTDQYDQMYGKVSYIDARKMFRKLTVQGILHCSSSSSGCISSFLPGGGRYSGVGSSSLGTEGEDSEGRGWGVGVFCVEVGMGQLARLAAYGGGSVDCRPVLGT